MNLFDSANYPTSEPTELVVGDRWQWKRTNLASDYPTASYALSYTLRLEGADAAKIDIAASESGDDYLVEVPHSTTSGYAPGRYHWQAYITRSSDNARVAIAAGIVTIKANRATSAADPRTHARKCLDSIEAALEAFAGNTVQSYTITTGTGSRSVTHREVPELLRLRSVYQAEVARETTVDRLNQGRPQPNKVQVRF